MLTCPSLLEAAFAVKFPTLEIFLRSLTVKNVLEAADAPFSEHAWSILTGSYVEFGDLNGTLGGNGGMGATAAKVPPETWAYAMEGTMNQGVLNPNMKKTKDSIEDWNLLKRYADDGSELAAYEEAVVSKDEAGEECRDKAEELRLLVSVLHKRSSNANVSTRQDPRTNRYGVNRKTEKIRRPEDETHTPTNFPTKAARFKYISPQPTKSRAFTRK
jgi:hypothetical protein